MLSKETPVSKAFSQLEGSFQRVRHAKLWSLLSRKRQGRLLTVEGMDGVGKSTLIHALVAELLVEKIPFKLVEMFPKTQLNELVFWDSTFTPLQRTLLMKINADQARLKIAKALEQDRLVICERGGDTFMAYQGFGEDLLQEVWTLGTLFDAFPVPDLTLLLDTPVDVAMTRLKQDRRGTPRMNRFPYHDYTLGRPNDAAFFQRVREGFSAIQKHYPKRITTLDATQTPDAIYKAALQLLSPLLKASFSPIDIA